METALLRLYYCRYLCIHQTATDIYPTGKRMHQDRLCTVTLSLTGEP